MKKKFTHLLAAAFLAWWAVSLPGQNVALDFDGANDYISVSPIAGWAPNSDFTFEAWFTATPDGQACIGNFRRLFSLFNPDRFEVGQCGGELYLFWTDPLSNAHFNIQTPAVNILDGAWHCIGVVRSGPLVDIYLDGGLVYSVSTVGTINFSLFRVGHWGGGPTPTQDWLGGIDEVKLWNVALPASHLMVCSNCPPPPPIPGQSPIVHWPLDDGIPGQPNTVTTVADVSGFGNSGVLNSPGSGGHDLTDPGGNFIPGVPIVLPSYHDLSVFISDPVQMVGIPWVCDGASVHFSLVDPNFNIPQPGAGVTVDWYYSDNQGPWTLIPSLNGFQFGVPANVATSINCPGTTGYVDREYRAIITVTNANGTCVYTTQPGGLRIYCEITQLNLQVTPPNPLCEGDQVSFNVSVTTNLPNPAPTNDVHIDWCISTDGGLTWTVLSQYYDQPGFTYPTITVGQQDICFKALVTNLGCPSKTGQVCIKVDPNPVCGNIIGWPTPANLTLVGTSPSWLIYEICPENDATVGMDPSGPPFQHCNPQWQYSFGDLLNPNNPALWTWVNLGFSNSLQNTNILPTSQWGSNTSIFYRIACMPLSTPSACDPCYSNIVEIKLKTPPPVPTIVAVPPNQTICHGDIVTLYASNDPGTQTTWYCNGEAVWTGPILPVSNQACYWTEVTDGCYTLKSDTFCLKVCAAVAIISCPIVNPCIIPNLPITLSGLDSYSVNCGPVLQYQWEVEYFPNGPIYFFNTPTITFTPPAAGAVVTLTVVDSNGCTHSVQSFFKPCQP